MNVRDAAASCTDTAGMLTIAGFIVLLSGLFRTAGLHPPGLTRAPIAPLAPPWPPVQPSLDLAHTDAIGCPHEPNLL